MSNPQGGVWGHAGSRGCNSGGSGTRQGDALADGLTVTHHVMLRAADFDRDRASRINLWCRMARMDLSNWCGDRGLSRTWAG